MPPRFSYWTIIAGGLPTAFRAADREELLPTFTRLREKQPDAEMKWFARGKLWASPEEARQSSDRRWDDTSGSGRRDARNSSRTTGRPDRPREARGKDWRPGGEHRDPRQPFTDARKARNQRFKAEKFARRSRHDNQVHGKPHGDPLAPERRPRGSDARAPRESWRSRDARPEFDGRHRDSKPPKDSRHSRNSWQQGDERRPHTPRDRDPRHARDERQPREARQSRDSRQRGDNARQRDFRPPTESRQSRDSRHQRDDRRPHAPRERDSRGSRDPRPQGDRRPQRDAWQSEARPAGDRSKSPRPTGRDTRWDDRGPKSRKDGALAPRTDWKAKPPRSKPHRDTRPTGPEDRERHATSDTRRSGDRERWTESRPDGRTTYRGEGHGSNSWRPKPPRPQEGSGSGAPRPFAPRSFERERMRGGGGTEEPTPPPRPRGPNREPNPSDQPPPTAPPRPNEPVTAPPGPPERGRLNRNKRSR